MVIGYGLNVETLALEVNDMYENLVYDRLVIPGYNPVSVMDNITRPESNSGRPVPRTMRTTYSYNENVATIADWEHPSLSFTLLSNDNLALKASLFVFGSFSAPGPSAAASASAISRTSTPLLGRTRSFSERMEDDD